MKRNRDNNCLKNKKNDTDNDTVQKPTSDEDFGVVSVSAG